MGDMPFFVAYEYPQLPGEMELVGPYDTERQVVAAAAAAARHISSNVPAMADWSFLDPATDDGEALDEYRKIAHGEDLPLIKIGKLVAMP